MAHGGMVIGGEQKADADIVNTLLQSGGDNANFTPSDSKTSDEPILN